MSGRREKQKNERKDQKKNTYYAAWVFDERSRGGAASWKQTSAGYWWRGCFSGSRYVPSNLWNPSAAPTWPSSLDSIAFSLIQLPIDAGNNAHRKQSLAWAGELTRHRSSCCSHTPFPCCSSDYFKGYLQFITALVLFWEFLANRPISINKVWLIKLVAQIWECGKITKKKHHGARSANSRKIRQITDQKLAKLIRKRETKW